jgi:hypothetical protein
MLPHPCCYSLHIDGEVQLVELLHPLQQLVDSEVQLIKLLHPLQQLVDSEVQLIKLLHPYSSSSMTQRCTSQPASKVSLSLLLYSLPHRILEKMNLDLGHVFPTLFCSVMFPNP